MPGLSHSLLDWLPRRAAEQTGAPASPLAAGDNAGWRGVAAAVGLSIAGVSSPIAVTATAAAGGLLGPPLAASALLALLVLAPAGVGLATALSGLRRVATAATQDGSEAEQAVLRVFIDALLFICALGLAALAPNEGPAPADVPVAALALVVAWAVLLHVILWPAPPPLRRCAAMALDIALFSAFLHFGGGAAAGWYPLYLLAIFYAGWRFGRGALLGMAIAGMLGFAAVVLSTPFWRQQPGLAAGLWAALAVLPALAAGAIRAISAAQAAATAADADRRGILLLIAEALRGPLATIGAAAAPGDRAARAGRPDEPARATRALALQLGDVADFASLAAGAFAAPVEAFDLRALVKRSLAPLQTEAAEQGVALRWRVDPHLPSRLRGRARALARLVESLAGHAVAAAPAGTVRIALDAAAGDARRVRLRLQADAAGAGREPGATLAQAPFALRLVERMAALMGGRLAIERPDGRRTRLALELTLAIAEGAPEPVPDLAYRPVLIATADGPLAADLAGLLAAWHGDPRQVGDADAALAELARLDRAQRPVVILDGRVKLLSALSLAHRAARAGAAAPFVLLIAEEGQRGGLGEVDEGELDGFLPAPVTERLLANALHALALMPDRPASLRPAAEPREASSAAPEPAVARITPIAAHPKFAPEPAAAVDARVIEGLRALGGGPSFLRELVESFRAEALQLMQRIDQAVASADAAGFARSLIVLHRAAIQLGGTQLCGLLASLQSLPPGELRQRGALHVQRLDAEIDRLAAALLESLPAGEAGAFRQ